MKTNNRLTPLQVVERYHEKYLEYEKAFNDEPFSDEQLQENLTKIIESGVSFDSPEFEDAVIEAMIEKPTRRVDVNNAALKFSLYTNFFILTQEEDLPINIQKDYDNLPINQDMKPFYSIKDGKFIRNEDSSISVEKEKLKFIYQQIKGSN